jgi:hypothetical protein
MIVGVKHEREKEVGQMRKQQAKKNRSKGVQSHCCSQVANHLS